jgi:tetratricopeptide (TPR) repeat protein
MQLQIRSIILALMATVIVSIPAHAQKKPKDSKAQAAFEAGEYFEAIDLYKDAYNRVDKDEKTTIFFKIGECYRILGDARSAVLWYKKAVREEYQDPIIFLRFGQMLLVNEQYDEANEEFRKYVELVPDDPRGGIGIESCEAAIVWNENPTGYIVENMRVFNSRERDFSPAYINESFNEVYFTSTREDATGNEIHGATGQNFADMFSTTMDRKGKWSVPVPVEDLNSEFEDGTPCISPAVKKGKTSSSAARYTAPRKKGTSGRSPSWNLNPWGTALQMHTRPFLPMGTRFTLCRTCLEDWVRTTSGKSQGKGAAGEVL